MHTRTHLLTFAVVLACACTAGCASAPRQPRPVGAKLTVGVTAAGRTASSLTLNIAVEPAGIAGSVKADAGVFTTDDLPFGTHVVRLTGVPAACRVEGGAERTITVSEERRFAVLRFDVRCE